MFNSTPYSQTCAVRFSNSMAAIVTIQLLLIALFAGPAVAQLSGTNPGIGFPSFGSFAGSEFDTVNEGNLNIHFSIPVFQKTGRGLSVVATISYNSLIWTPVGALTDGNGNPISSAQWVPPAINPWGFTVAPFTSYVTYTRTEEPATACGGSPNRIWIRSNYTYHAPDGTGHSMSGTAVEADCAGTPHGFGPVMTQDGSGYSLSVDSGMGVSVTTIGGDLSFPSRLEVFANSIPSSMPFGAVPAELIDTNGNVFNALDTLGTQALQVSTPPTTATISYPSPTNPANRVGVTLNYTTYTIQTAFNCPWFEYGPTNQLGPTTAQLVTSISMPDGSSYSFTYEPTPGAPANTTGRLTSVTLPTGATIRYTRGGVDCADGSDRRLTRITPDGTWTYARQITESPFSNGQHGQITSSITTVTDPLGNVQVINFGVGDQYESKRQIYSGSTNLLETIETCYNGAAFPCTNTLTGPSFTQRTVRREFPDTTGKVSQTDTHLLLSGLVTDVYEYDFGSGSPGPLLRHTATTYNTLTASIFYNPSQPTVSYASTIYNRPATVTVTDGSGATQSQTSFFYDETTPIATSGTPQHVQVTGSRGNLTTVKKLVSGTTTIQKTTTYFDTGTVNTDSDFQTSPPNLTTYGYGTNSCGNSYPDTVTNPLWPEKTTVWDCNGGVATSSTDQNNQPTSYIYGDPNYWRVTETDFPDGGVVSTTYNLGTNRPWNIVQTTKQTSTQNITKKTIYDNLARVSQQQLTSDPEGIDLTDTTYDIAGHVHSVSNPYRLTTDSTYGLTSYTYDGLGRVTTQTQPDGSTIQSAYSANCTTVTDETGKQRKSCSDGLGRMVQVFEDPGSSPHLNYETDYQYNTLGDLICAVQKGTDTTAFTTCAAAPTTWRPRSFTYDLLSRLLSATNPESGTISYTYDAEML
jgi:YD repeat-containing protein